MGRIGEGEPSLGPSPECCMCGDHGLSSELFLCKSCGFRSQHKYCSSLYPGAQSYHICNWCLTQKDDKKGEETTKSSQPSSHKTTTDHHDTIKIKKSKKDESVDRRRTVNDHSRIKKQINKLPAPPPDRAAPPPSAGRKRVVSDRGGISERAIVKRSRSESKGGIVVKPVFRNRVRRYKLLDEVSS